MISGSISALVVYFFYPVCMKERNIHFGTQSPINICNGLIAGLVSITAGCNNVQNYSAFLIGGLGGFIYIGACKIMNYLKIDDPCKATQIHGFCGFWGVLAVGFFQKD